MLLSLKCRAHGGGIALNLFGLTVCYWGAEEGKRYGLCGMGGQGVCGLSSPTSLCALGFHGKTSLGSQWLQSLFHDVLR